MPKPSEQTQINFIADYLRKGEQRADVLAKFSKKWQKVAVRTFDRRLEQAKTIVATEQEAIKAKAMQMVSEEAEALKSKIMSSQERMIYLSTIANCKTDIKKFGNQYYQVVVFDDGRKEFISQSDKLKAIAELNKMDGSYAATKIEATVKEEVDLTKLSTEELIALHNIKKKIDAE